MHNRGLYLQTNILRSHLTRTTTFIRIGFLTGIRSSLHIVFSLTAENKFSGIKRKRGSSPWNISHSCTFIPLEGQDQESHPFTRKRQRLKETDPDLKAQGGALLDCFVSLFFKLIFLFYNSIISRTSQGFKGHVCQEILTFE